MSSDNRTSADDALPSHQQTDSEVPITLVDNVTKAPSLEADRAPVAEDAGTELKNVDTDDAQPAGPSQDEEPPAMTLADAALMKQVNDVLTSEIGIATLLTRLKQSIASAKEFANFLKKRAILEDDHAQGLKKLCRSTQDSMRRSDHRQGSFAHSHEEMMAIHERMAENGIQFAASLHQMHEDLSELASNADRNRKVWKATGLSAEQKVADLEQAMRKSKTKYDSLAEEYDRARTGEAKQSGKVLGAFKAHKSAAQQEEDLLRKVQAADQAYHGHVQAVQTEKSHLVSSARPEAVKALQDLIHEADSGLALQMQKFAAFNEKLLLGNGLIVYPTKNQPNSSGPQPRSLRQAVSSINNERDLNQFVSSHHSKVQLNVGEIKYERHPVLNPQPVTTSHAPGPGPQIPQQYFGQAGPPAHNMHQQQSSPMAPTPGTGDYGQPSNPQNPPAFSPQNSNTTPFAPQSTGVTPGYPPQGSAPEQPKPYAQPHTRSFSHGNPLSMHNTAGAPPPGAPGAPQQYTRNSAQAAPRYGNGAAPSPQGQPGPPQLGALSFQGGNPSEQRYSPQQGQAYPPPSEKYAGAPQGSVPGINSQGPPPSYNAPPTNVPAHGGAPLNVGPPAKPVFGVPLNRLYERDGLAVPMVVYQCIQAVDLYGLGVEGIYRQSGSLTHINKLKSMFDAESQNPALDFRNPENFYHDVNSVTGLLKQFFRDLPDPLLTNEHHESFIAAAKHDDDVVRRDSLHAIINSLPDPNYATLRAMTLHLHRVMDNAHVTRMNSHNLAVILGPTLMGTDPSTAIADAGWQIRVIDTILQNTYQIFDED